MISSTPKSKKVAAALAAVQALLQEEALTASQLSRPGLPSAAGPSAWALGGRLSLMSGRLAGGLRGRA